MEWCKCPVVAARSLFRTQLRLVLRPLPAWLALILHAREAESECYLQDATANSNLQRLHGEMADSLRIGAAMLRHFMNFLAKRSASPK